MNHKKLRVVLSVLLLSAFVSVFAQQKAQQMPSSLGVEIVSKDGLLYLPVSTSFRTPVMHIRTQSETNGSSKEPISALRVAPEMDVGKVKVNIFALYGDASAAKSCSDWRSLKAVVVATYTIGEGESITVSELSERGIKLGERQITLRVVPAKPMLLKTSASNDCICAVCDGRGCCAGPGECVDCGCGPICCPLPPVYPDRHM